MGQSDQTRRPRFEAVGFDLDNTLYPSSDKIQEFIRGEIAREIGQAINVSQEEARELFERLYAEIGSGTRVLKKIAEEYAVELDADYIVQSALEQEEVINLVKPDKRLQPFLEDIARRVNGRIDLLTGSQRHVAFGKLERLGVSPSTFVYQICGDYSKVNGDMFKEWIRLRQMAPGRLLYVGDNVKADIIPANELGLYTCLVGKEDKRAEFCIETVYDLVEVLDGTSK
ncbi:MAG: HAD family hydrolase [archaeon]